MGKEIRKKLVKGVRNPNRKNGKAWKKNPKDLRNLDSSRTPEREMKFRALKEIREEKNKRGILAAELRLNDLLRRDEIGRKNSKDGTGRPNSLDLKNRLEMALPQWYKKEIRQEIYRMERREERAASHAIVKAHHQMEEKIWENQLEKALEQTLSFK